MASPAEHIMSPFSEGGTSFTMVGLAVMSHESAVEYGLAAFVRIITL